MPPRVRNKVSKALKENIGAENKLKSTRSTANRPRKVLGDKTNSASDDNLSSELLKTTKAVTKRSNVIQTALEKNGRPRRDRRLPSRFVENLVLGNLSNNKDTSQSKLQNSIATPTKNDVSASSSNTNASPFKTPSKSETSLVVQRPRRICRLPSKLSDVVSPDKYIPIQPANASTPITVKSKAQQLNKTEKSQKSKSQVSNKPSALKFNVVKKSKNTSDSKVSPDTNNNAKRSQRLRRQVVANKVSPKQPAKGKIPDSKRLNSKAPQTKLNNTKSNSETLNSSVGTVQNDSTLSYKPNNTSSISSNTSLVYSPSPKKANSKELDSKKADLKRAGLRQLGKNQSFQVLGGKKSSTNPDVYEFTFDPNEEPPPQKKKRKRNVTRKPPKPKTIVVKSSYDTNISKALDALKSVVKPSQSSNLPQIQNAQPQHNEAIPNTSVSSTNQGNISKNITKDNTNTTYNNVNYASIRIEDIAADIEPSINHDINYSPVNSPRPSTPQNTDKSQNVEKPKRKTNDPLNLAEELSFFDEVPVASSSMNASVRHPLASPWRVEFGSLPIKWNVNTYVKANMTPAVECSFINAEDTKKRHVYTNMVAQDNEPLPEIVSTPNYKQTSIISFIKEVADKSARKKMGRTLSPTKANSLFDDISNVETSIQQTSIEKVLDNNSNSTNNSSKEKENSLEKRKTRKRKNDENVNHLPAKSPRKDKDATFFGFDDSENQDVENVSPVKKKPQGRSLRQRRPVLQELNGPARAEIPAAKSKVTSAEAVNKVYEELKSASDAPVFVENNVNNVTHIEEMLNDNDDSQSVHLFEDIDVVHHLKPTRKSYGKAKKVTFQQHSSDSEVPENVEHDSSDEDVGDFTFEMPNVQEKKKVKKKKPKKLMSKKEEKEAAEWAAGFNSMCEDIEEFPLIIE